MHLVYPPKLCITTEIPTLPFWLENLPLFANIYGLPFSLNIVSGFETFPSQRRINVFFAQEVFLA